MQKEKTLREERIDTDVLVVGAGAGGMMAAISAADCGAHGPCAKRATPSAPAV